MECGGVCMWGCFSVLAYFNTYRSGSGLLCNKNSDLNHQSLSSYNLMGGEVDLVIRKSGCRLAFCVGVFLVRGCSVGIYPLGADSSLETREGRCESCLNLAATAAV